MRMDQRGLLVRIRGVFTEMKNVFHLTPSDSTHSKDIRPS
jgi:hypothetical protein